MLARHIGSSINRILGRNLHFTVPGFQKKDGRGKRVNHIKKKDNVEGEAGAFEATHSAYQLIDENLMERVFDGLKFKDIDIMHIICSRNNTKVGITSGSGTLKVLKSAGTEGFKNCRKGTTVAAQAVAKRVVNYATDHDINMIRLVFNGLGPGRGAAYKVIELSGLKVVSLSDRTDAVEPWVQRPRAAKSI